MQEVYDHLYVGPQRAYEDVVAGQPGWRVVHASKEPYHRRAVGYDGADPPTTHPEYLVARREHRLMLNLIDAPIEVDIPKALFNEALAFIHDGLIAGDRVLVHCQQGVSRSASIAMLYLGMHTDRIGSDDYTQACAIYSEIYPPFNPGKAIEHFLKHHWSLYTRERKP